MKSETTIDLRTPYCAMLCKRNTREQILIRQEIVRYAQVHGIKPAARHYACSKNTVRKWLREFKAGGAGKGGIKLELPIFVLIKLVKILLLSVFWNLVNI